MSSRPKFAYGTNPTLSEESKSRETLNISTKVGYGVGHIFNDMLQVYGLGYILIFLQVVVGLQEFNAGLVVLFGQISDGLSTALIGLVIDGDETFRIYNYYGKQKTWHLFGTMCVLISFPFFCLPPIGFGMSNCALQTIDVNDLQIREGKVPNPSFSTECIFDDKLVTVYYTIITVLLNFGWAAVQNSHLSMIPHLTSCDENQLTLNAIRSAATAASFIFVYSIVGLFFKSGNRLENQASDELQAAFQNMMIVIVSVGAFCSYLFHQLVKEKDKSFNMTEEEQNLLSLQSRRSSRKLSMPCILITSQSPNLDSPDKINEMKIYQWFLEPQFYLISLQYMMARLFFLIAILYIPFFVKKTLNLPNEYMATVPLVMFIAGLTFSGLTKYISDILGVKKVFVLFCGIGLVGCLWILLGCNDKAYDFYEVFGIAITIGAASSSMLLLSTTMIGAFIGVNVGKRRGP